MGQKKKVRNDYCYKEERHNYIEQVQEKVNGDPSQSTFPEETAQYDGVEKSQERMITVQYFIQEFRKEGTGYYLFKKITQFLPFTVVLQFQILNNGRNHMHTEFLDSTVVQRLNGDQTLQNSAYKNVFTTEEILSFLHGRHSLVEIDEYLVNDREENGVPLLVVCR